VTIFLLTPIWCLPWNWSRWNEDPFAGRKGTEEDMKSSKWLALVVLIAVGAGCNSPAKRPSDPPAEPKQTAQVSEAKQSKGPEAPPSPQVTENTPAKETASETKAIRPVVGETITTPSGLKYMEQWIGKGREAKTGDIAVVHYTGFLVSNGNVFDSSLGRDPLQFKLGAGNVIKGWDEGVVGMKVGGKRILTIPAKLAYGNECKGPIPPNSDLRFEVELVRIAN
jgi:FKBP-type peptidyl-prolyl cis-trans isomerase